MTRAAPVYHRLTLYFYNNEPSKNKHFLILLSRVTRYSQEPGLKRIFEILWVLFEEISSFYSDWPKFWIWQTLGHVRDIFCNCHLHNASKEVFWPNKCLNSMRRFKSAILAIFQFWQSGTLDPMHGIQTFLGQKTFWRFWMIYQIDPKGASVTLLIIWGQFGIIHNLLRFLIPPAIP